MLTARTRRTTCFRRKCTRSQMIPQGKKRRKTAHKTGSGAENLPVSLNTGTARKGTAGTGRANTGNSSGTARNGKGNAAAAGRTYAGTRSSSAASSRSRRRSGGRNASFSLYNLLKLLVPVLCIVLLLLVVKVVKPERQTERNEGPTAVETMETTEAVPEETESTGPVYRTTDVLNVRPEPSTSSERIGQLNAGVTVEYVRAHDADWAVILYNGQEAYVASRYLQEE